MGNRRHVSGHYEIANARRLFEQSKAAGKPDFRFVALAIGAVPLKPPRWAVEACIQECEATEIRSASLLSGTDRVLDEIVRVLDEHQNGSYEPNRMSLRSAVLEATRRVGLIDRADAPVSDDQIRLFRNAWDREQDEDRKKSPFPLEGYHTTHRTHRVLLAEYGTEMGMPADAVKALWRAENSED